MKDTLEKMDRDSFCPKCSTKGIDMCWLADGHDVSDEIAITNKVDDTNVYRCPCGEVYISTSYTNDGWYRIKDNKSAKYYNDYWEDEKDWLEDP